MTEFVGQLLASIFGTHSWIATILVSMIPMFELKGAIPIGMSSDFWGNSALGGVEAFLLSLLGSCLVVPILALLFKPLINWLKKTKVFRKLGETLDKRIQRKSDKVMQDVEDQTSEKKKTWQKMLGVFLFVSVPLPLTGVWTGTCIAVAIGLKFWQTIVSVIAGNIVAGLIIVFVCSVFPQFTTILFYIIASIIIAMILVWLIKMLIEKIKHQKVKADNDK